MPKRMTKESIGYDTHLRAVVSPWEMSADCPHLRRTLFDFDGVTDPSVEQLVETKICDKRWKRPRPVYRLEPGQMALCGVGFVTGMPFSLCYLTLCRSGMSSKFNITVANGPGTIDPDYRGEAGVNLHNCGTKSFYLYHGMRIAQVRFDWAMIPVFRKVGTYKEFDKTARGSGGFGSTGLHK